MSQRAEEPMSLRLGKEGKDIHPSFIPSFLQRALSETGGAPGPALPSGQWERSLMRKGDREAPDPALGVVRAGFLMEVTPYCLEGQ